MRGAGQAGGGHEQRGGLTEARGAWAGGVGGLGGWSSEGWGPRGAPGLTCEAGRVPGREGSAAAGHEERGGQAVAGRAAVAAARGAL